MKAQDFMKEYVENIKKIYGDSLVQVILYGSHARGDFTKESDIDVMILLDMTDRETRDYTDSLIEMTYDFNLEHNVDIQPFAKSKKQFKKWVRFDPFLKNVENEGIILYDAA